MATTTFNNIRLQLKYDSYANWLNSSLILNPGEIGICTIPAETNAIRQEPAVIIKVGDGEHLYKDLPVLSAKSGDVASWALAENKPAYEAKEITGIDAYIAGYVNEQMGISVDTDTQYQIVTVDAYTCKLQSKGKTDEAWADVSTITMPNDTAAIDALKALVGTENVAKQIGDAITALDLANTYAAKSHTHEMGEVNGLTEALAGKQAAGDYATKAEAQGYADAKDEAIAAAKKAGDDAQGAVDALAGKVGEVPADKTVVQMINEAQTAATYDDTQVKADIKANADAIDAIEEDYLKNTDKEELQGAINTEKGRVDTLVGNDANKSVRTIAAEELAAQLIAENAQEALDTLGEIAAWIQAHPGDAAAMNRAIDDLEALVGTLPEGATATTVVDYVNEMIAGLKIGDYAKAADLTAAVGRIAALEANVDKWNAAEQNAKDYADGLNTTMDGRVQAVEGKAHEHANKELLDTYTQTETNLADAVAKKHEHENAGVLNGITAEKVAAWDAAEQNAKDYTDELEGELSAVAKSGNVNDLIQTTGDVLILDCGNSEA